MSTLDPNAAISAAQQQTAQSVAPTISNKSPLVYLGMRSVINPNTPIERQQDLLRPGDLQRKPYTLDADSAANLWYSWGEDDRSRFRSSLSLAGVDTTGYSDAQWASAWGNYVSQAAAYYQNGAGKQVTPWDILSMDRRDRESQGPKTTTSTNTSTNLSTKGDVEGTAYDIARALLGRAPTDDEVSKYTQVINEKERANPTTQTTTTTTQPSGSSSSTSTTSGGVSAASAQNTLRKQVQGESDYGEYQAATTYYDALVQMLGGG